MTRVGPIQRAQEVAIALPIRPGDPQRPRLSPEPTHSVLLRRGHGPQDPDPGVEHERRRRHPGHERDLRVPVLGLQRRPELQPIAPGPFMDDLLLGHRQGRPTPRRLQRRPFAPHFLQQHHLLVRLPLVDQCLHAEVVASRNAAHERAPHVHRRHRCVFVQPQIPHVCRSHLLREQARRPLGQPGRMQRHPGIGQVDRLPPPPGLRVDRPTCRHEPRHVGDGIAHPIARTLAGQNHRLVEVHRPHRVQGPEAQVGEIDLRDGHPPGLDGRLDGREHLGREVTRHVQFFADRREPAGQRARLDGGGRQRAGTIADNAAGHAHTLGRARPCHPAHQIPRAPRQHLEFPSCRASPSTPPVPTPSPGPST